MGPEFMRLSLKKGAHAVGVAGALHGLNKMGRSPFRCCLFPCSEIKELCGPRYSKIIVGCKRNIPFKRSNFTFGDQAGNSAAAG